MNTPLAYASTVSTTSVQEVQAEPESVLAMISRIAEEVGISSTTLANLVWSESRNNPEAMGDKGCSYGLTQINLCVHKSITKEQALDPEWSLRYAAKAIQEDKDYQWTACNCYSLVSTKVKLPRMAQIHPNSSGKVGSVAIFYYGKVKHIAYVTEVSAAGFTVQEANKTRCHIGSRFVKWTDPSLAGFYNPN